MSNKDLIKILILSADPMREPHQLRLDEEVREIEAAIERSPHRDRFQIFSKWAVRSQDIRRALLQHHPQIVHFSGHGSGSAGLVFEKLGGRSYQIMGTETLAHLFNLMRSPSSIQCVVFNACNSKTQVEAISKHIDIVIGMNYTIGDGAAIKFSSGFYDALGAGRSYIEAFEFGRNAISLEKISEDKTPILIAKSNVYPLASTSLIRKVSMSKESKIYRSTIVTFLTCIGITSIVAVNIRLLYQQEQLPSQQQEQLPSQQQEQSGQENIQVGVAGDLAGDLNIVQQPDKARTDIPFVIRITVFDNLNEDGSCADPSNISEGFKKPRGTCMWDYLFLEAEPDIALQVDNRLIPCSENSYSCELQESFKAGVKYDIKVVDVDENGLSEEIGEFSFTATESLRLSEQLGRKGAVTLSTTEL